jgi:hypothetical protein
LAKADISTWTEYEPYAGTVAEKLPSTSVQVMIFAAGELPAEGDAEGVEDAAVDEDCGEIDTVAPGIGMLPDFTMP